MTAKLAMSTKEILMKNVRRIDTHQHYIPPRYAKVLKDLGVRPGGIDLPSWSRDGALRVMDANSIATGILSVSTPGAWLGDLAQARYLAREVNEYGAELVDSEPDRFGFFATLTLPDVEGSLIELAYAMDELRADGIVLLANAEGRYLGHPEFNPLLAELDRRGATVFVHPGELPGPEAEGIPTFAADFLLDTTRTAISLMLSGSMKKYPRIKFILAHAGGFVPYIQYRILLTILRAEPKLKQIGATLDFNRAIASRLAPLKQFYWDTALSASPSSLAALVEVADPKRITYGSDWPFAPAVAVKFMTNQLDAFPLRDQQRAQIERTNALALFPRLDAP